MENLAETSSRSLIACMYMYMSMNVYIHVNPCMSMYIFIMNVVYQEGHHGKPSAETSSQKSGTRVPGLTIMFSLPLLQYVDDHYV